MFQNSYREIVCTVPFALGTLISYSQSDYKNREALRDAANPSPIAHISAPPTPDL